MKTLLPRELCEMEVILENCGL